MSIETFNVSELVSLGGSAIAVISTFYFWLVRAKGERPHLVIHPIGHLTGFAMMASDDGDTYRRLGGPPERTFLKYGLRLAIVNNSSLPNALLDARVWIEMADGKWRLMDVAHPEPGESLFPVNLGPLTTHGVVLALATGGFELADTSFAGRDAAGGDALPRRVPIRVELTGLGDRKFKYEFVDDGDGLVRTCQDAKTGIGRAA